MGPPGRHAPRSGAPIWLALPQAHRDVRRVVLPDCRQFHGICCALRLGRQNSLRRRDHPAALAAAYLREYAYRRLDADAELCPYIHCVSRSWHLF